MICFLRVALVLLSIFVISGFYSCKSKTETYESDKGKIEINREGEKADITIKTKEGETFSMTINKGELPEGWPSDVPVISGGNIVFSQTEAQSNMRQISIESEKPMVDVMAFYKEKLNSGGWNIENTMSLPQMNMITAKKNSKELMLQIAEMEGKTHIQIIIR